MPRTPKGRLPGPAFARVNPRIQGGFPIRTRSERGQPDPENPGPPAPPPAQAPDAMAVPWRALHHPSRPPSSGRFTKARNVATRRNRSPPTGPGPRTLTHGCTGRLEPAETQRPESKRQPPRQGTEPARWYRVYTGTVLRLDHRRRTTGGRTVVARYGYVLPRQRSSALLQHLQGEACQRGAGGGQRTGTGRRDGVD